MVLGAVAGVFARLLPLLRPGQILWLLAVLPLDFAMPREVYAWLPVVCRGCCALVRFVGARSSFFVVAAPG